MTNLTVSKLPVVISRWFIGFGLFSILAGGTHFIPSSAIASQQNEETALAVGVSLEREIAGDQSHSYRVAATAGQFVQIIVEQKGIEVDVVIISPDGQKLDEFNASLGSFGAREAPFIARSDGDHRLQIKPHK